MARRFSKLQQIDNDHKITRDTDYEFLYHLQNGLLLALKEQGRLNDMQYRHAEERLKQQRRDRVKKMQEKGEGYNQSCKLLSCIHRQGGSGQLL